MKQKISYFKKATKVAWKSAGCVDPKELILIVLFVLIMVPVLFGLFFGIIYAVGYIFLLFHKPSFEWIQNNDYSALNQKMHVDIFGIGMVVFSSLFTIFIIFSVLLITARGCANCLKRTRDDLNHQV